MGSILMARSLIGDAESVPETFSSWHNCMSKAYCKWPAIVGIIIASLIVCSIIFCVVQCLCCGVSCARMLCCWGGGGGGGGRRNRSPKGDYSQMAPAPYGGYQPPAAQMAWARSGPTTATYDAPSKITEDSLPVMPSWSNARTHRVEDVSEQPEPKRGDDMEMGQLGPQQTGYVARDGYSQVPNTIDGPRSPTSPTSAQQAYPDPSTHAYGSDLGAQRMNQQAGGYGGSVYDQQPGSPAPTYHTYPVAPIANRVGGGALGAPGAPGASGAPSPSRYYYNAPAPSYAPSTNASTLYEQSHYTGGAYGYEAATPLPISGARLPNVDENTAYDNTYNNTYNNTAITTYDHPYNSSYGAPQDSQQRPPSLLQVGRKAVPGSRREV